MQRGRELMERETSVSHQPNMMLLIMKGDLMMVVVLSSQGLQWLEGIMEKFQVRLCGISVQLVRIGSQSHMGTLSLWRKMINRPDWLYGPT